MGSSEDFTLPQWPITLAEPRKVRWPSWAKGKFWRRIQLKAISLQYRSSWWNDFFSPAQGDLCRAPWYPWLSTQTSEQPFQNYSWSLFPETLTRKLARALEVLLGLNWSWPWVTRQQVEFNGTLPMFSNGSSSLLAAKALISGKAGYKFPKWVIWHQYTERFLLLPFSYWTQVFLLWGTLSPTMKIGLEYTWVLKDGGPIHEVSFAISHLSWIFDRSFPCTISLPVCLDVV